MNKINGRASNGRFALGNPGGPGNPLGYQTAALRTALLNAVSENDLRDIVAMLVTKAKAGDMAATRELLDRCLGKSAATVPIELPSGTSPGWLTAEERKRKLDAIAERIVQARATPVQSLPAIAAAACDGGTE